MSITNLYEAISAIAKRPSPVIPVETARTQVVPAVYYTKSYEEAVLWLIRVYNNGSLQIDTKYTESYDPYKDRVNKVKTPYERFKTPKLERKARRRKAQYFEEVLGKEWEYGEDYYCSKQIQRGREREDRDICSDSRQEQESDGTRPCDEWDEGSSEQ